MAVAKSQRELGVCIPWKAKCLDLSKACKQFCVSERDRSLSVTMKKEQPQATHGGVCEFASQVEAVYNLDTKINLPFLVGFRRRRAALPRSILPLQGTGCFECMQGFSSRQEGGAVDLRKK